MQDDNAVAAGLVSGSDDVSGTNDITKTLTVTPTIDITYKCKVTPPAGDAIVKTATLNVFGRFQGLRINDK